jgi:hypothetical protein
MWQPKHNQEEFNYFQGMSYILMRNNRFIFGVKGDVKNNLFYIDDQRVLYPAGHNVILYNMDEKTQIYIPGMINLH